MSLAMYKAYMSHKYGAGGKMIKTLTRDSVKYFVAIFCIYAVNQAIWLVNDVSLDSSVFLHRYRLFFSRYH